MVKLWKILLYLNGKNKYFKMTRKWKNALISVLHSNVLYFYQIKNTGPQDILQIENQRNWQPIWSVFKNLSRLIIHTWRSWLHSLIHTCGKHQISSNDYDSCICRRHDNLYIGYLKCKPKYYSTQPWGNILS